jgi:hypothetical protein
MRAHCEVNGSSSDMPHRYRIFTEFTPQARSHAISISEMKPTPRQKIGKSLARDKLKPSQKCADAYGPVTLQGAAGLGHRTRDIV